MPAYTLSSWLRKALVAYKAPGLMFGARAVEPEGDPFEVVSPLPLTADGLRVPVEVTGLEIEVSNFPAFPTSIDVSNFPQQE